VGLVCRSRDLIVAQEFSPGLVTFIHVLTANQATPALPPPGHGGEGSNEQSDNSRRPSPALKPLLRENFAAKY
jgi:hypothetical protein